MVWYNRRFFLVAFFKGKAAIILVSQGWRPGCPVDLHLHKREFNEPIWDIIAYCWHQKSEAHLRAGVQHDSVYLVYLTFPPKIDLYMLSACPLRPRWRTGKLNIHFWSSKWFLGGKALPNHGPPARCLRYLDSPICCACTCICCLLMNHLARSAIRAEFYLPCWKPQREHPTIKTTLRIQLTCDWGAVGIKMPLVALGVFPPPPLLILLLDCFANILCVREITKNTSRHS